MLRNLKADAERHLGEPVTQAVLEASHSNEARPPGAARRPAGNRRSPGQLEIADLRPRGPLCKGDVADRDGQLESAGPGASGIHEQWVSEITPIFTSPHESRMTQRGP